MAASSVTDTSSAAQHPQPQIPIPVAPAPVAAGGNSSNLLDVSPSSKGKEDALAVIDAAIFDGAAAGHAAGVVVDELPNRAASAGGATPMQHLQLPGQRGSDAGTSGFLMHASSVDLSEAVSADLSPSVSNSEAVDVLLPATQSLTAWRHEEEDKDDDQFGTSKLGRALGKGRRMLRRGDLKGSVKLLEAALLEELPETQRETLREQLSAAQSRAASNRTGAASKPRCSVASSSSRRPRVPPVEIPATTGAAATEVASVITSGELIALTIRTLCVAYSKLQDWEAVCYNSDLALTLKACPLTEDLRIELHLRRGIAWLHRAGAGGDEDLDAAKELPRLTEVLSAEQDLQRVLQSNSRDPLALQGLETIQFLKQQGEARDRAEAEARVPDALRGIARIRAMDA